jgi:hypothetical protein
MARLGSPRRNAVVARKSDGMVLGALSYSNDQHLVDLFFVHGIRSRTVHHQPNLPSHSLSFAMV